MASAPGLDRQPQLLFQLHEVNQEELIAKAGKGLPLAKQGPAAAKVLGSEDLAGIFGLDMAKGVEAKPKARKTAAGKTKIAIPGKGKRKKSWGF